MTALAITEAAVMFPIASPCGGTMRGPGQLTLHPAHSPNLSERSEPMSERTCSVDDCPKPARSRGWCSMHYDRWRRTGQAGPARDLRLSITEAVCACGCGIRPRKVGAEYVRGHRPPRDPVEAFWANVDRRAQGCWVWTGNVGNNGYGRFWHPTLKCNVLAHRFSRSLVETLIEGQEIDHLCRNKLCVRPSHLEQVSPLENKRRAWEVREPVTHCRHGHAYDAENTYLNSAGYRECRTCLRSRGKLA